MCRRHSISLIWTWPASSTPLFPTCVVSDSCPAVRSAPSRPTVVVGLGQVSLCFPLGFCCCLYLHPNGPTTAELSGRYFSLQEEYGSTLSRAVFRIHTRPMLTILGRESYHKVVGTNIQHAIPAIGDKTTVVASHGDFRQKSPSGAGDEAVGALRTRLSARQPRRQLPLQQ
jgi:hypothetical protein